MTPELDVKRLTYTNRLLGSGTDCCFKDSQPKALLGAVESWFTCTFLQTYKLCTVHSVDIVDDFEESRIGFL